MRFTNKTYAVAVITGLALSAVAAAVEANAQARTWCGYSGSTTECTYTSEAQCRASHRDCLPRPN